jgi:diguanylate cyclase (GGDEF)-like protein
LEWQVTWKGISFHGQYRQVFSGILATELTKKTVRKAVKRPRSGARVAKRSSKTAASKKPSRFKPEQSTANSAAAKTIRGLKTRLAAAQARIDELQAWADTDFLLNIYNRRGFERELTRSLAYIKRYGATGALIVLDVDRLKPINDTYGHAAGDVVLKGVVEVLMRHVRSSDVVGRLGGDEFGLLLWNLSEDAASAKAMALEAAIDHLTFVFKGHAVRAGASAGVALLAPMDAAGAALEQADKAMYARKEERRSASAALKAKQ